MADLEDELNAHLQGFKKVFVRNQDSKSDLTQFAYGFLSQNQESGSHIHQTMEEYFFFLKGNGQFEIDGQIYDINPLTFVKIPHGVSHNLLNANQQLLEFVYFGIALDNS